MNITKKQQAAIEKITGETWDSFPIATISEYFAYTDRGIAPSGENELITRHKHHAHTIEAWRKDFKCGLLYLQDFIDPGHDGHISPDNYIRHAFEIYHDTMGFIPKMFCEPCKGVEKYAHWLDRLGLRELRVERQIWHRALRQKQIEEKTL